MINFPSQLVFIHLLVDATCGSSTKPKFLLKTPSIRGGKISVTLIRTLTETKLKSLLPSLCGIKTHACYRVLAVSFGKFEDLITTLNIPNFHCRTFRGSNYMVEATIKCAICYWVFMCRGHLHG